MKAIKFVILGAGLLGLLAFFLPYAKIESGDLKLSFSAMDVMKGVELAEAGVGAARKELEAAAEDIENVETKAEVQGNLKSIDDALDVVKGIILILFAPCFLFVVIAGVGAGRGKLERLGGVGVLILGLIGMAANGQFLAAWGTPEVKAAGGSAGIAQYLLMISCTVGFVGGLLTIIKPDRGGRFS
jgi:hypothetical protein